MPSVDCGLTSGLNPYVPTPENPWNEAKARFVLRRLGFGATRARIEEALLYSPAAWIDRMLDEARTSQRPAQPVWANQKLSEYGDFQTEIQNQILEWGLVMVEDMRLNPLRAKLHLFWSNHFVARLEAYACPSWMYQYWKVLDDHCLGNFKTFTESVGTTPAMLVFLNGVQNTRLEPNENYARELFELFTLGRDQGYTQTDITQTARALTGYNLFTELCAPINYLALLHDPGPKTIFGRTGNYNYNTLHDLLFQERASRIARFICGKLYRAFVSPDPDPVFTEQLAQVLLQNNFNLMPVYRALFQSERFFDPLVEGAVIKSPLEYFLQFLQEVEVPMTTEIRTLVLLQAGENGQFILNPPDVAGWPGDKDWINTSKLTQRWLSLEYFVYYLFLNAPQVLEQIPQKFSESVSDPDAITADIMNAFLPKGLQNASDYEQAARIFRWEVPQNYYDSGEWNIFWPTIGPQVAFLMQHLIRTPEFQLI
jgi:uncharacterized protein (DUF1800 family)